jgi:sulfite exporter TauE/SafE/copper chaperone CopZ
VNVSSATSGHDVDMTTVHITGMTCAACEQRVGRALAALPGVEAVTVSASRARATLTGTPPPPDDLREAVERAGYTVGVPPWITRDRRAWGTVALTAVAVGAAGALALWSGVRLPTADGAPEGSTGGLGLALLVGLAAGVSTCMALVGGLVLGVSAAAASRDAGRIAGRWAAVRPHLVFTAGRLAGFAAGGALLGAVGSAARLPDRAIAGASVVAAAVMLLLGVRLTGLSPRISGWALTLPGRGDDPFGLGRDRGALVAGAATFLLPCGFTQAVQLYAISLGSPGAAAATMTAFAVGTVPGLLGLGTLGSLSGWRDRSAPAVRAIGVVVLAFAVVTGTGGLRALGVGLPRINSTADPAAAPAAVSPNVRLAGDVQIVTMTQSADGYFPSDITVWAGIPIRWTIDATAQFSCSAALRVPTVGVAANLTEGTHVIDVPALPVGTTPFSCAMGMYVGSFQAIPRPAATPTPSHSP